MRFYSILINKSPETTFFIGVLQYLHYYSKTKMNRFSATALGKRSQQQNILLLFSHDDEVDVEGPKKKINKFWQELENHISSGSSLRM